MTALRDALGRLPDEVFVDLLEGEDAYLLEVDLPGATSDTVDVRVESGRLVVDARRPKDPPEGYSFVSEERPTFVEFELPLPPDAAEEGASARMESGVLTVTLPRTSAGRTIPIED